ncbi:choice-of-anchor D domain-containing protein [Myxococcota bacterium]|nr:choice-of-anchor D domain-containing protein [Myxococcota bacterium]
MEQRGAGPHPGAPWERASGWRVRALAAVAAGAVAGCGPDSNLNRLYPDLVVAPEALSFGGVVVPYDAALELQLINAGRATLDIGSIAMESGAAVYTVSPATAELAPDESVAVLVTFDPATYLDYSTDLVIGSNDPEQPQIRVPVDAQGIDGPVPELSLDPLSVDWGEVVPGMPAQGLFTIHNTGTGPLEILDGSGLSEGSAAEGVFTVLSDPAGRTVEPGGSYPVIVEYGPTDALGDWAFYDVRSNDPLQPEARVLLVGNGGGSYEYPVAVIEAETVAAPLQTVTFDGSGSYDPQGYEPLTWTWTLFDQPAGSSTRLSDVGASAPSMFLDAAGVYTVILQVENAIGVQSAPVTHQLIAVPADDLYVLLSWNTGNSDLDLHLVRDDPALYFISPDDACFCNPNPDWGESGSGDDPQLALDNRVGYGPENINVESPADGQYHVKVHYFQDNSGGSTEATVEIHLSGALAASYSRVLTEDQVWDVATVSLPEGLVTEETTENWESTYRACQ